MYRSDRARSVMRPIACPVLACLLVACGDATAPSSGAPVTRARPVAAAAAAGAGAQVGAAAGGSAGTSALPDPDGAEAAPAAPGSRVLEYPDELQMLMLAYRLAGRQPPLDQWASEQVEVRIADEFSRDAVMRAQRERLQRVYDGTRDVGRLRLAVAGRLSKYDASRGGYYIDAFLPGSVLQYRARLGGSGETIVAVRVSAPAGAEFWPLSPAEAKRVLAGVDVLRQITLDSEIVLSGAAERGDGLEISARLTGYRVVGSELRGSATLGERSFPAG